MLSDINTIMRPIWLKLKELFPWITAVLAVLSSNWASNALWETFELWSQLKLGSFSLLKTISILLFGTCVVLIYRQRNVFFRPRTRHLKNKTNPPPRKHLLFFLSTLNPDYQYKDGIPDGLTLTTDFGNDLKEMMRLKKLPKESKIIWNWEMPLRALWYHRKDGVLKTSTIVCSRESINEVNSFLNICKRYDIFKDIEYYLLLKKKRPELVTASYENIDKSMGWDFESFDELSNALWCFLEKFINKEHLEKDIIVDFTGGQKVTSVVAAALSFNRKIKAQYVQTGGNCDVVSYDVILASSDTEGVGL
ncbi:MAG: hypothetical protein ACOZF0_07225 [Thermodesulfobacteriota bacterium]